MARIPTPESTQSSSGSHVVAALQTVVSRELPPLAPVVVTVGTFQGGTAFNVIPSQVELSGTVRTVDASVFARRCLRGSIALFEGVTSAMRAEYTFQYVHGYPVTVNDVQKAQFAWRVAAGYRR